MLVSELIERLLKCRQDAKVFIAGSFGVLEAVTLNQIEQLSGEVQPIARKVVILKSAY